MNGPLEKWDLTSVIIVASTIFICFTLKRNVNVLKTVWNKNKKQRTYHHHRHSISENEIFLWMKRDGGHHEMQQPVSPKIATLYADRPSRVSSRFFVQAGHETKYRTRAIITRSWFETALNYKPRILDLKIEELPLFST